MSGITAAIQNRGLVSLEDYYSEMFKTVPAGSIDMKVDGSSTAVDFDIVAAADTILEDARIIPVYSTTAANFVPETTFGGGVVMANGIIFQLINAAGAVAKTFNPDKPIKKDMDWGHYGATDIPKLRQANNKVAVTRWSKFKAGNRFYLPEGWSLRCKIRDDLTNVTQSLGELGMTLQGTLVSRNT